MSKISSSEPDWSREQKHWYKWDPARSLIASLRRYQRHVASRNPVRVIVCKVAAFQHRFWSAVAGCDIPINTKIDGGLIMPHPNGVVIHSDVQVGPNCLIFQQVTIGSGSIRQNAVPHIGGHVDIGAGAKILGKVHIGDHAQIGANAVVLIDVPAYATAVGVPARILQREIILGDAESE
jgi:serine O-acetyltransferase